MKNQLLSNVRRVRGWDRSRRDPLALRELRGTLPDGQILTVNSNGVTFFRITERMVSSSWGGAFKTKTRTMRRALEEGATYFSNHYGKEN